jgi:hypothetical protein
MAKNMTTDHIERIAERSMDLLDKQLTTNLITQAEYDVEVRELERWAREMYRASRNEGEF